MTEPLADFALHQLLNIARRGEQCEGYEACKAVKALTAFTEMREAFNKNLHSLGISPFMSKTNCEELFPMGNRICCTCTCSWEIDASILQIS